MLLKTFLKEAVPRLFLCLLLLQTSRAYYFNINQLRDLESTDENGLKSEANAWYLSSYYDSPNRCYNCAGTWMLGGYKILGGSSNQYFERIYKNLPGHSAIYYSLNIWIIDSVDPGDKIGLYFDGAPMIYLPPIDHHNAPSHICGYGGFLGLGTYDDLGQVRVTGTVAHSGTSLTFRVYSYMDTGADDEAFGLRDINFMFVQTATPATTPACVVAAVPLATSCPCTQGPYCGGCNVACATCLGPLATQCLSCKSGYIWDGTACIQCHANCNGCIGSGNTKCLACQSSKYSFKTTTCLDTCTYPLKLSGTQCSFSCNPDEFLYWDNSCSPTCDYPLQMESQTTTSLINNVPVLKCKYPCTSGYLYWDGFCRATCSDPPLTQRVYKGYNFCDFPCTNPAQPIVYWNKTCLAACNPPLSYANIYGKQFCQYPCTAPERLYNNGSCIAGACQQYFKSYTYNIENRCDYPCSSTQSLYSNGTCLPQTCQKYYKSFSLSNDHYCNYPCLPNEHLYNNGSCFLTCDWRFTLYNTNTAEKHCDYKCSTSQYLFLNNTCLNNCPPFYNAWHDKITGDKYCDRPCQPSDWLYSNGSCLSPCQPYYNQVTYTSDKFCNYPCKPNEYLYSNGTCIKYCHPHFTPVSIEQDKFCNYPCTSSEYLNFDGKCVSSCDPLLDDPHTYGTDKFCYSRCKAGDYLYENGTCLSSCPSGFNIVTNGDFHSCNYPCASTEHLYNNGTCKSSCNLPFISNTYSGNKFCSFPCSQDDYLHDNGTCLSSCNSLFVQDIVSNGKEKYCHHSCPTVSDYIYWNGTCLSYCDLPYRSHIEGSHKFCLYPCSASQYLYWNGTCNQECKFPLISRTQAGLQYCDYPCSSTQYLLWNGSCVSSCPLPSRIKNQAAGALCVLPCEDPDDYYYEYTRECRAQCDMKVVVQDNLFRKCLSYDPSEGEIIKFLSTPPTEPGSITISALPKSIHYLRYVNISYPMRVQRITYSKGMNPISHVYIVPVAQQSMLNPTQHQILSLYDKYDLSSSFIVNFWPEILILGGILAVVIVLFVVEFINSTFAWIFWQNLFERIRIVLGWNLVIMIIATNIDSIILYSALEFRTLEFDSVPALISFLLCVTSICLVAGILFISAVLGSKAFIIKEESRKSKTVSSYAKLLSDWQSFQIVYRGLNNNSLANSLFYMIYVIRTGLPMVIAVNLYQFPMIQTTLFVLISVATIGFISYMKPIKKYINHIQLITIELLLLLVNIGIFILAILDNAEVDNGDLRTYIGDAIIVCNFLINLLAPGFLIAKVYTSIRAAFNMKKTDPTKSQAILLQTLFLPIQQAGFGFEQVQMVSFSNKYADLSQVSEAKPDKHWESFKRLFKSSNNNPSNASANFEMSQDTQRLNLNESQPTVQYVSVYKQNLRNYASSNEGLGLSNSGTSFPINKILKK